MSSAEKYVVGVDYGTLSGRALLVRVSDGKEMCTSVFEYPHAVLEERLPDSQRRLPADWALQVPQDYVDVLKNTVPDVLKRSGVNVADVIGITTDFTACTVLPILKDGTPICELPGFADRPHAYVKLWKHHSAQPHADRINDLAHDRNEKWIAKYGGKISSEWEFAKALQLLEEDPEIYLKMDHWIEAADWIIWQLTGKYTKNICTAGYKAIYQDGDYPSKDFLAALNPGFANFVEEKVRHPLSQLGDLAGSLTAEAASWTGLNAGIAVAVGNVDAHVTSAAANATHPGQMVAIMGTSTCHVMVSDQLAEVPGMCGVVMGGIVPGQLGYEAGQSGVGDIFGWFANNFVNEEYAKAARSAGQDLHTYLSELASRNPVGSHGLVALDWESGNRSTLVDHHLSGLIVGMTLATRPEDIYQAIVESTAFGARKIVETFDNSNVPVKDFIAAGGLIKNAFVMQIYADVLNRPIHVISSDQGPALGSAIHAAVAAGAYKNIQDAAEKMGGMVRDAYVPRPENAKVYQELYAHYLTLDKTFGKGEMMHALRDLRNKSVAPEVLMSSSAAIRKVVSDLNKDLQRYGLVAWTAGNVSQRLADGKSFVIKPSGVKYDDLTPDQMVICDLDGKVLEGTLSPSSDTAAHAYIYRHMDWVNGVVHTHSNYASAWATAQKPIPCALTAMGDEFGGDIPLGPFALIGNDDIGKGVVETLKSSNSRAVLMINHGVFTIGESGIAAVKTAVMCEDVAKTMYIAAALGPIKRLEDSDINQLFARYQNVYGQPKDK